MRVQRATATLSRRNVDFDAVLREHLDGRSIEMRKRDVVDAARQKGHFAATLADRGKYLADLVEKEFFVDRGRKAVKICHAD